VSNELQPRRTAPPTLRARVQGMANAMLVDMVGETKAAEAGARTALAFAAAHRAAKDPSQIERCSPESIAACVATSALTGLMPGGPNPLCWLIPKGGQLTWMPSHRGLTVLAQRAGYQIVPVAVGPCDDLVVEFGEVVSHSQDYQNPPTGLGDLQGVIIVVKRIVDGVTFGRYFIPGSDIVKRSKARGAGPVWRDWPIEMAMKTAIKWTFSRGLVPCETVELAQAVAQDNAAERVEVVSTTAKPVVAPSAAFLLDAPAPPAEDAQEPSEPPADVDAPEDGDAPPWGGE
jgi:recombinational DNA repair protein RecT